MANSQPPDPQAEKTWISDTGELFISDGTSWQPYQDVPDGDDPDPNGLFRES